MTVKFEQFRFVDYKPPLSLEETFKLFTTWANVMTNSFDSLLSINASSVTGIAADNWSGNQLSVLLPSSFEITYDTTEENHGIRIYGGGGALNYRIVRDTTGYPAIYKNNILAFSENKYFSQNAEVRIVFRQQQFANESTDSNNPNEVWNSISLYANNKLVIAYIDKKATAFSNLQVTLLAYDTDIVTYSNVHVPELAETAEFGTLDQSENAMSGLTRSIEGRYLRFFVRYDGSFRAYRVKSIASSLTIPESEFEITGVRYQYTDLATHIRMVGAYIWSEAADLSLIEKYGHRFRELNNPMLLTEDECQVEAYRSIKRMQEEAFVEVIKVPNLPFIEIDDRITTPEGDWLLTSYSLSLEDGGYISQDAEIRIYVWGDI